MLFDGFQIRHHQREGFVHTQFAGSQFSYSICICGVTRKMKSAQAFDGDDLTFDKKALCLSEGFIAINLPSAFCFLYFLLITLFLLFFLPFIIKLSIHAAIGSGGGDDFISHVSMLRAVSTRLAASMPVTQARSKKKAGVS